MTCRCGDEHPTSLEALACDQVLGGLPAHLTAERTARLNRHPDEAWLACLAQAHARQRRLSAALQGWAA